MRIVFDLDGTLADGAHREHFISGETKNWDAYFEACDGDTTLPGLEILRSLWYAPSGYPDATGPRAHQIEIWSGRGEGAGGSVRQKTRTWLLDRISIGIWDEPRTGFFNNMAPHEHRIALRMRGHTDHTPDNHLKRQWLETARNAGYAPNLVFDDRQKVVDMWRAEGVPCFQVAPGDF